MTKPVGICQKKKKSCRPLLKSLVEYYHETGRFHTNPNTFAISKIFEK